MIKKLPAFVVSILLITAPSFTSAGYDEGIAAFSSENFELAYKELLPAAEAGDARAYGVLGMLMSAGLGTERSLEKGIGWVRRGVETNDPGSLFVYGSWLYNGSFVTRDLAQGTALLRRSAKAGFGDAQAAMGKLYMMASISGSDTAITPEEALHWTQVAAEANHTEGLYYMGMFSLTGMLAPQDQGMGRNWLIKAARKGHFEAIKNLASSSRKTDPIESYAWYLIAAQIDQEFAKGKAEDLAKTLNADQIATGTKWADAWIAADGKETDWPAPSPTSETALAGMVAKSWPLPGIKSGPTAPHKDYDVGGVAVEDKDYKTALAAFQTAAAAGDRRAFGDVGWMLAVGLGVRPSLRDGLNWVRRGIELADPGAQTIYGNWLTSGRFVPRDTEAGLDLLRKAAKGGYLKAQAGLSGFYVLAVLGGHKSPLSSDEGVHWTKLAAMRNAPDALNGMGFLYLNGLGVRRDVAAARRWFRKSALLGEVTALTNLGLQAAANEPTLAYQWFLIASRNGHDYAKNQADQIIKRLSKDQIAEAEMAADDWKLAMARRKAAARNALEVAILREAIEAGGNKAAVSKLRSLASKGNTQAQILLGDLHMTGDGVIHNYSMAVTWYRQAAEAGDADAQFKLSGMYRDNLGVPRYMAKAREWMKRAAESGHPMARQDMRDRSIELAPYKEPEPEEADKKPESN